MAKKKARKKRIDAGKQRKGYKKRATKKKAAKKRPVKKAVKKKAAKKKVTKKAAAKRRDKPISDAEMRRDNEKEKFGTVTTTLKRRHYEWLTGYAYMLGRTVESALELIIRGAYAMDNDRRMKDGSNTVLASDFKP